MRWVTSVGEIQVSREQTRHVGAAATDLQKTPTHGLQQVSTFRSDMTVNEHGISLDQ
jgi:hypothetical protein